MSGAVRMGIGRYVDRALAWFHRWAGIVLALLFVAWFASGAVLLYVPFPSLSEQDRLAHSEPLDPAKVAVTPATALVGHPGTSRLTLISVAGRPMYLTTDAAGKSQAMAADDGRMVTFSAADARTVAERFSGAKARSVVGPFDYDQWVVHQRFDQVRPLFKVSLEDDRGSELYVSARTGQVLQATTRRERVWNYCGAVLHWLYFTPLRRSWSTWNEVVWWLSLAALLVSVAGTWLGIDRLVKTRAHTKARYSPYRGWMRWHHVLGLCAGVVVLAWMLSGWLSMDHGRLFSRGQPDIGVIEHFRGATLREVASAVPAGFLARLGPVAEVRFNAVAAHPFVSGQGGRATRPIILWLGASTPPAAAIAVPTLLAGLRQAWPEPTSIVPLPDSNPDFYAVAESLADSARAFDVGSLRVYVDRVSGDPLVVMDAGRRAYAWVYYALHTLNFPMLLGRPLSRDLLVSVLLALGLIFISTGVVVGYRRLGKTVREIT